jgi:purine-binding chemotaxis protein CheW
MSRRQRRADVIDWPAVRARLQQLHDVLQSNASSAEQARAILDERARALGRPHVETPPASDSLEVLIFAVGVERYAIETKYVREVVRFLDFTPVPGTPDFVIGVTNYRGQVLCVVNLRSILGVTSRGLTDLSRLIVVGNEAAEFGILADRTDTVGSLRVNEVLSPSESIGEIGREYLVGVTRDALVVLNGAQLLHDSRLSVDEREAATP